MNFPPETKDRDELLKKWQHVLDAAAHIPSWTSGHELAWLCELSSRSTYICEIGSYYGKSALCMALANPDVKILSIDICDHAEVPDEFEKNLAEPINEGRVRFRKGTSHSLGFGFEGHRFDAAFIDGGHTFKDVEIDISAVVLSSTSGAIISGHDWNTDPNDGVNRAVNEKLGKPNVFESIWWIQL